MVLPRGTVVLAVLTLEVFAADEGVREEAGVPVCVVLPVHALGVTGRAAPRPSSVFLRPLLAARGSGALMGEGDACLLASSAAVMAITRARPRCSAPGVAAAAVCEAEGGGGVMLRWLPAPCKLAPLPISPPCVLERCMRDGPTGLPLPTPPVAAAAAAAPLLLSALCVSRSARRRCSWMRRRCMRRTCCWCACSRSAGLLALAHRLLRRCSPASNCCCCCCCCCCSCSCCTCCAC